MKILRIFFCILASVATNDALAEPAVVQSGEHANFTRLVVPVPSQSSWTIEHSEKNVIFQIDNYQANFDISSVFELIPRLRISSISAEANSLDITLDCDCRVAAFLERERFVVIDVASPGAQLSLPFIRKTEAIAAQQKENNPSTLDFSSGQGPEYPKTIRFNSLQEAELIKMKSELSQQLGVAAATGLLSARGTQNRVLNEIMNSQDGQNLHSNIPKNERHVPLKKIDVRVSNSQERIGIIQDASEDQLNCISDRTLDIHNWADDRPFAAQVGLLRQDLYQEFDVIDQAILLRLAKLYLYYGLGTEARNTLELAELPELEYRLLANISEIVENGYMAKPGHIHSKRNCRGGITLWALMAEPEFDNLEVSTVRQAVETLGSLPQELRSLVAPVFANRLYKYGDFENAAATLRTLSRASEVFPDYADLIQAKLEIKEGDLLTSSFRLERLLESNSQYSPQALVDIVKSGAIQKNEFGLNKVELIDAFSRENRGEAIATNLNRTKLITLIRNKEFDAAFRFAESHRNSPTLHTILLPAVTDSADDIDFANYAVSMPNVSFSSITSRYRTKFITRLLSLGFPSEARSWMNLVSKELRTPEDKILLARIALVLNQPQLAMSELFDVKGREPERLRSLVGEYLDQGNLSLREPHAFAPSIYSHKLAKLLEVQSDASIDKTSLLLEADALSRAELTQPDKTSELGTKADIALIESGLARTKMVDLISRSAASLAP